MASAKRWGSQLWARLTHTVSESVSLSRELTASHLAVALLLLVITAGFSYGAFRSYLLTSQENQLKHSGFEVARVMQGYFTGAIDAPTANYLLTGLEGALDVHVFVVDRSGEVILSTGPANVPAASLTVPDLTRVLVRGETWSTSIQTPRGAMTIAGVPIELTHAIVGGIFLEEPEAKMLERAAQLLWRLLLGGAAGVLVAAFAARLLSRRLALPLSRLRSAAEHVADGELSARVEPKGPLEVLQLGERFNQMAASLERLVGDLRRETKLRDELLAHVAHDLKTPLTTIRGYLEAMQDGLLKGPERDKAVRVTHAETLRLQRLVGRLLEAARLEATLKVDAVRMPVKAWAEDVVSRLGREASARGVTVTVSGPAGLHAVLHPDALTEVLMNLLTNALAVSPHGAVVKVNIVPEQHGVTVTVSDEGPGIPAELRATIFEPFVTGEASRTGGGTGLGLAIAARLVQAMGGRIGIGDQPGRGAMVWFWIPDESEGTERSKPGGTLGPA